MKIVLNKNQNVWFSSDFHYGHGSIVKGVSKWENKNGCRNFETLKEHDDTLVNNINSVVMENDILFFLGDWSFGGFKNNEALINFFEFRDKIKCKNIHFILGNHDQLLIENKEYMGRKTQDLFSSVSQYKEVRIIDDNSGKALKYTFFLCHYAMRVWDKSHHGNSIHLFGHSHDGMSKEITKVSNSMDVGVDCHPEFRPFSFHEIRDIMAKRNVELEIDHHN